MMTMNCDMVREQLSAFMDDELSSETAAEVQLHLDVCESCAEELAQFKLLGELARVSVKSSVALPSWDAIEQRLSRTETTVRLASNDHVNGVTESYRNVKWSTLAGAVIALAATVLLFAKLTTPDHDNHSTSNQASVAAVNLQPVLELFQRDTQAAVNALRSQFALSEVDLADADVGFGRPTYVSTAMKDHVLPGGATVASTKTFSFPSCQCPEGHCTCGPGGCNCIACVCERPDGSTYLVFEQCKSQAVSFGDLPVQIVKRDGREIQQVTVNGTNAISFNRADGKLTVVGLRSEAEVDSLFASL
jgi:Putative zinc-finger